MKKHANYCVRFELIDADKAHGQWKRFLSAAASLASQFSMKWSIESPQAFYVYTAQSRRYSAEALMHTLFANLESFVSRDQVRIDVASNDLLLEDLLNQMKSKMQKDLVIDDWYVYYISPKTADALKGGKITSYFDLIEHKQCEGTEHYGEDMAMRKTLAEIRATIEEIKSKGELGLVMSVEMLHDGRRVAYFGPFLNMTGNYRTKLSVRQQKPEQAYFHAAIVPKSIIPELPTAKIMA